VSAWRARNSVSLCRALALLRAATKSAATSASGRSRFPCRAYGGCCRGDYDNKGDAVQAEAGQDARINFEHHLHRVKCKRQASRSRRSVP